MLENLKICGDSAEETDQEKCIYLNDFAEFLYSEKK